MSAVHHQEEPTALGSEHGALLHRKFGAAHLGRDATMNKRSAYKHGAFGVQSAGGARNQLQTHVSLYAAQRLTCLATLSGTVVWDAHLHCHPTKDTIIAKTLGEIGRFRVIRQEKKGIRLELWRCVNSGCCLRLWIVVHAD